MGGMADTSELLRRVDFIRAGRNDRGLRRGSERGDLVAVMPGVYVDADRWRALDETARHLLAARAFVPRLAATAVFSHDTAALVHGWDQLGPPPDLLEVTDPAILRTRRGAVARLRASSLSGLDVDFVDGLPVTSAARTAVDTVAASSFRQAVVVLDSALRVGLARDRALSRGSPAPATPPTPLTLLEFDEALLRRLPVRAPSHVQRVRAFADGRAGSAGESLSRVILRERAWPAPTVQQPFSDRAGNIGDVDFWWEEFGVIGEFDGAVKYSRGEYLRGRTPAEAVIDEKRREDRLRAHPKVRGFARWMWADLMAPSRFDAILSAAGVRR